MLESIKDFRFILIITIILGVTIIVNYISNRIIKKFIANKLEHKEQDVTNYKFLQHFVSTVIFVVGIGIALSTIPGFEAIGHSLLASAGVLSLVIGVASQQSIGNMVSGVFIVMYKPFRINDKITIDNKVGRVEDINLRHVILRDLENNRIIIPNSIISNQIIVNSNLNDERVCKRIDIGISYSSDVDKALAIMQKEIANHPLSIDPRSEEDKINNLPIVKAKMVSLGDYAVTLRAWAWANSPEESFDMFCDVLRTIKKQFELNQIDIPCPPGPGYTSTPNNTTGALTSSN